MPSSWNYDIRGKHTCQLAAFLGTDDQRVDVEIGDLGVISVQYAPSTGPLTIG